MRKILIRINQLLLILSTTILLIFLVFMTTILNKKYILSYLEKNNYYNKVYHDSLSTLEGYTIQVGLTSEEVEKILPKEKVEVDIKNFIDCIYKNQELKIDATILTDNLEGLIQEKLKENHRDATEEEVVAINNLKKQVADSYEDKIIYSKKYALKLRDSYHKFSCHQNKILFLLFSLEFFLLALLGLITKTLALYFKILGSSFLSTFFFLLLGKILIQPKLQHVVVFSSILSKLAIAIINSLFKILFLSSMVIGIIGLILIIIGIYKSYFKKN